MFFKVNIILAVVATLGVCAARADTTRGVTSSASGVGECLIAKTR